MAFPSPMSRPRSMRYIVTFRLLETGASPGAFNMGLDEAILNSVAEGLQPPTLRFYGWNPPAITLGYFQGREEEVDRTACAQLGVDVIRRVTGGGAVFHDAELTYSIVLPESHPLARADILDSYRVLCAGIVEGLGHWGLQGEFVPLNDILVGGRKISGNAQTRKRGCILQHGTILLDVDVDRMFALLKVPSEKLKGKLIQDAKERVTGLRAQIGRSVDLSEAADVFSKGFASALKVDLLTSEPSTAEIEEGGRIAKEKYSTEAWNGKRP